MRNGFLEFIDVVCVSHNTTPTTTVQAPMATITTTMIGLQGEASVKVTEDNTALALGSGTGILTPSTRVLNLTTDTRFKSTHRHNVCF
jgi:hypothetical protein